MPLETAQNIGQLDESNPKTTDLVSQSGDHIRLIKTILKKTFPNFTTPLAASAETLDKLASGTFGASDFTGHKLTGIVKGEADTDAVNVAQLAEGLAKAVKDANGAAWGDDKSAGGHALKDLKEAQSDNQATPLSQVTRLLSEKMSALQSWANGLFAKKAGDTFTGAINVQGNIGGDGDLVLNKLYTGSTTPGSAYSSGCLATNGPYAQERSEIYNFDIAGKYSGTLIAHIDYNGGRHHFEFRNDGHCYSPNGRFLNDGQDLPNIRNLLNDRPTRAEFSTSSAKDARGAARSLGRVPERPLIAATSCKLPLTSPSSIGIR